MTIYDIAKEAGVAASTVSRVINDKPGIKPETRARIQKLLLEYNYTPNETARGLVMQSTKIIGILMPDMRVAHHTDSAYTIEHELTKLGYCCITMSTGFGDKKMAEYVRILEQRRVEGAIFLGSVFASAAVQKSLESHLQKVPVIIANGYLDLPNVYGIVVDEGLGIRQCVDLLRKKGHRKLAFVLDSTTPSNQTKRQGFISRMMEYGWEREHVWLYETKTSDLQMGYDITTSIVSDHPDIEGIIYSIDLIAAGGVRALYDLGFDVPSEVAVLGVDNTIYGEITRPKLSTLDNRMRELSLLAADILVRTLNGEKSPHKTVLATRIVEREST